MPSSDSSRDALLERLSEEFVERYRRGECPALSEYAGRHPELAAEIRDLFPALVKIEHLKPVAGDLTGAFVAQGDAANGNTPERLGDYRILREVGRGGMGIVYEAEQESLGRHVALKVLPPHGVLNPSFLERFRREAKAAARLHHTNIVPVFGVGECSGVHFYAMQFIRGDGLDKVLHDLRRFRSGPRLATNHERLSSTHLEGSVAASLVTGRFGLDPAVPADGAPPSQTGAPTEPAPAVQAVPSGLSSGGSGANYYHSVARVALQVADALAYAHRQGVLHRDIKPSNLLLDTQSIVWITDFGLAKEADPSGQSGGDLSQAGDIVGTVRFMAPERFDGHSLPQSDVYSLGATLYELLTLRPAFDDMNKGRLVEKVLHEPPAVPHKVEPSVPRDLETIVLKCLAKEPAGRYATAEALAEDLRRFLADRPIKARRTAWHERTWRWCRRNPAVASLLATVAVLLVAVATVSTIMAARLNWALGRTREAEREARLREAEALVEKAHGTRHSRRAGQRFEALAALDRAAVIGRELGQSPDWFDELRNEAIAALALPDLHITYSWDGFTPGTHIAQLSQDFGLYARTTNQGACSIRRVADDVEVGRLPQTGEPTNAWFGPGRLLLEFGENSGRLLLWDLNGPEPVLRLDEHRAISAAAFRSDGRLIVTGHPDGSIGVYQTDTGNRRYFLEPHTILTTLHPDLHPTEPIVAISSFSSNLLQVRDLETGALLISQTLSWRGSGACAWSPDGRTLAVARGDDGNQIHLYAFDPAAPGLRLTRTLQGSSGGAPAIRFNPAGDRLATRGWGAVVDLFDVSTGRLLFSTKRLSLGQTSLMFDLTGKRLGAARVGPHEEQIGLWSVGDAREYRALVCDDARQRHKLRPAVHPDGRLAALGMNDGVALWDLETGRQLAFVRVPRGGGSVCFDGGGNLFSNSFAGCFRWPVRPDTQEPGRLVVGPPERVPFNPGDLAIAASTDGRVLAQGMFNGYGMENYAGGWILHSASPEPRRVLDGMSVTECSVSPDGQLVAFGGHLPEVNVYETATGRRVWQSPTENKVTSCCFSRDGRWLVIKNDDAQGYRVGTWEPGPQLGPGTPSDISPDNRLVVLHLAEGSCRLVELATGRELARLQDPEQNASPAVFTPDGTRLVVSAEDGLRVWDLRRIRAELTKFGLDWDAPPYPEAPAPSPEPLEVRVVGAELADPQKMAEHESQKVVIDLFVNPFNADAHYRLGSQLLATGKIEQAYAHLTAALAFQPSLDAALFPRGEAAFRLRHWKEAHECFTRHLTRNPDDTEAYHLRGHVNAELGRLSDAVTDFTEALQRRPNEPHFLACRGENYRLLGQHAEAVADCQKSLGIQSNQADSNRSLAWIHANGPAQFRDLDKAPNFAQRAVAFQPDVSANHHSLGLVYYRMGQWKEAIAAFEKGLEIRQGHPTAYYDFLLAMCHAKLGEPAKAKEYFDRAVKWVEGQKDLPAQHVEELKVFRAEAEELLRTP